jgi:hypothetical protein
MSTTARRVQLDTPEKGTIALTLRHGVPSMPDPQGIDSIVVRDVRGQLLFRDDFNDIDTSHWEVTQGAFRAKNGILEAVDKGYDNVLQLKGQGYKDVIVTVVYRNALQAAIEVRKETQQNGFKGTEPGVAYYSFNLVRDFPVYVEGRPGNGEWWTEFGLYVHVTKRDLFKSLGTMLVGSDNMAVEVNPNPDTQLSLPVHQIMLVVNGIHIVEALKLDEIAAARAYEFAFVVQPLKIKGGTGSTVAPIAIR